MGSWPSCPAQLGVFRALAGVKEPLSSSTTKQGGRNNEKEAGRWERRANLLDPDVVQPTGLVSLWSPSS